MPHANILCPDTLLSAEDFRFVYGAVEERNSTWEEFVRDALIEYAQR